MVKAELPEPPPLAATVICPAVVVVMVMLLPATRLPTPQPEPAAIKSWPLLTGAVLVPVPPLVMGSMPVTSLELKTMGPMFNSPPTALTTPVPKEDKVVEPEARTLNKLELLEEATVKTGRVG
jgi:hypothetical protein